MEEYSMNKKRLQMLSFSLALVVLAAAIGWIAGTTIRSPAEAAARTAAPPPSPILVPVEQRILSATVVTRGAARYGSPLSLSISKSELKPHIGTITTVPARNSEFAEGDVVLTISGRPVFILRGETPAFRDMSKSVTGQDVLQLEEALSRIGFEPGAIDGTFDEQTGAAVAAWYQSNGWEPFGPTEAQLGELSRVEEALESALNASLKAEDDISHAMIAVEAARAAAESDRLKAQSNVNAAQLTLDRLLMDEATTRERREQATADLEQAKSSAKAVELTGEVLVNAAQNVLKLAEREAESAGRRVARLGARLDSVRASTGTQVPLDEILFASSLPVRVEELLLQVGELASGPLLIVTNNQLIIDSSLSLADASLVKKGMSVLIDEPELGIEATGVVERIAGSPGTDGVDGYHVYFETFVDQTEAALEGFSLRLTIPVETTGGAVTAVPVSALSLAPDGTSRIQIDSRGVLAYITVEPGFSADGYVEVTSSNGKLEPGQLVVVGYEQAEQ